MISIQEIMQKHVSDYVEARYREIESYILATCHATGCTPYDFELVETHHIGGTTWRVQRRSEGKGDSR